MYFDPQKSKSAYRSYFMPGIVFSKVNIQNKKRIMRIGAVEVCKLEIGTHIVQVRGQFTLFSTVPPLFSTQCT